MRIEISVVSAKAVAARWKDSYLQGGKWLHTYSDSSEDIYNRLLQCPDDRKAIADIIGNKTWSYTTCSECREDVEITACLAESDVHLCRNCLVAATAAINAVWEARR